MSTDHEDTANGQKPRKSNWWKWAIGLLLLLALCDDDDDEPRRHCYEFTNGETRCFEEPLPAGKHCYMGEDNAVRCFDEPQ